MCIALYKPAGKRITKKCLLNCYTSNRDGAGFAYVKDGEVIINKGFFDFEKFWEAFQPFQDLQCLIHFRIATHKSINGANCHPWRVIYDDDGLPEEEGGEPTTPVKGLVFIHNGIITNCSKDTDISDTGNFNKYILQPLIEKYPDFWITDHFKWLVEASIGKGNKLAFLRADGEYRIFNEDQGYWDKGIWFSNKSYNSSYQKDFFILQEDEDKYKEDAANGKIIAANFPRTDSTEEHNSELSLEEQNLLQQTLANSDVQIFESLDELDAALEQLNSVVTA